MSTNKTQNYQLHKWEADDDFLRTEFNENFVKLDTALRGLETDKLEFVFGSYVGNQPTDKSTPQRIEIGVKAKAIILMRDCGNPASSRSYSALFAQNYPCTAAELDNSGFTVWNVSGTWGAYLNAQNCTFYYLALV